MLPKPNPSTLSSLEGTKLEYLQIITFPPFAADALLKCYMPNHSLLAIVTIAAVSSMKESLEGNPKHDNLD